MIDWVADEIVAGLTRQGAGFLAGAPGTTDLSLLAACQRAGRLPYLVTNHESVAVSMADGYARASGRTGAVNVHATQGTLNALGHLRVALRDQVPVVCLASYPATAYAIHEPNHFLPGLLESVRPCVKWAWQVHSPAEAVSALARALAIASTPPFGPAYLAVPEDFLKTESPAAGGAAVNQPGEHTVLPWLAGLDRAAEALAAAHRPVLLAGAEIGRYGAIAELVELAEALGAPVISEARDRGPMLQAVSFPCAHPQWLGFFSRGNPAIQQALSRCDAVLLAGYVTAYQRVLGPLADGASVVQLEANPVNLSKDRPCSCCVSGDLKTAMAALRAALPRQGPQPATAEWMSALSEASGRYVASREQRLQRALAETSLSGYHIAAALREAAAGIVVVDDSQCFGFFLKNYVPFGRPGQAHGSLASHLGWGLPAALGVQLGHPEARVCATLSDGSFAFSIQALLTAARYEIPVIAVVVNNGGYKSLQVELEAMGRGGMEACSLEGGARIDAAGIALGCGVRGVRIEDAGTLRRAFLEACATRRPALLDVRVGTALEDWRDTWLCTGG